jgi:hypothetical protein
VTEPVSLDDIKIHLVLDPGDASEDANLSSMITAARHACELRIRRTIVGQDQLLVLGAFPVVPENAFAMPAWPPIEATVAGASDIALPGGTVSAVTVKYYDGNDVDQTLDPSEYYAALDRQPALLRSKTTWPTTAFRPDAVRITYTVSDLSADDLAMVSHAIRLIVGNWYENREGAAVDVRGTPTELPLAVTWLLDPLRSFAQ